MARRLVQMGHEVEWFTAGFDGAARSELVDGIHVVRRGRQWSVHVRALLHYRGRLKSRFDVLIDQVNTVPFFTPLWARIPIVMMIWQLAREVWWYESPPPLNAIGYAMEPYYLRLYRGSHVVTYSKSTAADLRKLGFRGRIDVLPVGISHVAPSNWAKAPEPTFVYVGRLAGSKRVEDIIRAVAAFRSRVGQGRLFLVGDGPARYVQRLRRLASNLSVSAAVEFCGWLSGSAKAERMGRAHALLMASAREGWGLVVTESNWCGTPAVVYDVPGLHDSVRDLQTGIVVSPFPESMAEGMIRLIEDRRLYEDLRQSALRWSSVLTFDASAETLVTVMHQITEEAM